MHAGNTRSKTAIRSQKVHFSGSVTTVTNLFQNRTNRRQKASRSVYLTAHGMNRLDFHYWVNDHRWRYVSVNWVATRLSSSEGDATIFSPDDAKQGRTGNPLRLREKGNRCIMYVACPSQVHYESLAVTTLGRSHRNLTVIWYRAPQKFPVRQRCIGRNEDWMTELSKINHWE